MEYLRTSSRGGTIARAFELAESGEYEGAAQIRARLKQEGYWDAAAQVAGPSLTRQLSEICRRMRSAA